MVGTKAKLLLIYAIALPLSACSQTEMGIVPYRCIHPPASTITSKRQAIVAAHTAWSCIRKTTSEADWLKSMVAWQKDGVWYVSGVLPKGYAGGGPNVELSQQTGEILRIYMTQ